MGAPNFSLSKKPKNTLSLRASAHTGVAIRSPRPPRPPWLPLWGSCHEVTERVTTPSPPLRGTSPIGRGKALIRLALAGDARATDTSLCNCHWQLLDFDSLRGAPPRRGRIWDGLPHQSADWFAMTASISVRCNHKEAPGWVPLKELLGIADALLNDGFHFVHMLQHILGQGDLAPGTNQVVIRPTDIKIQVAVQIVR